MDYVDEATGVRVEELGSLSEEFAGKSWVASVCSSAVESSGNNGARTDGPNVMDTHGGVIDLTLLPTEACNPPLSPLPLPLPPRVAVLKRQSASTPEDWTEDGEGTSTASMEDMNADIQDLGLSGGDRKSSREKLRRQELNVYFEELIDLLGLPNRASRSMILQETVAAIRMLRRERDDAQRSCETLRQELSKITTCLQFAHFDQLKRRNILTNEMPSFEQVTVNNNAPLPSTTDNQTTGIRTNSKSKRRILPKTAEQSDIPSTQQE